MLMINADTVLLFVKKIFCGLFFDKKEVKEEAWILSKDVALAVQYSKYSEFT